MIGVDIGGMKGWCALFKAPSLLRSFSCSSSNMIGVSWALTASTIDLYSSPSPVRI